LYFNANAASFDAASLAAILSINGSEVTEEQAESVLSDSGYTASSISAADLLALLEE
jgi:hypothetical protein